MKLLVHASIFSVIFAGFVASAVTTKNTSSVPANHSLVISTRNASAQLPSQYRLRTLIQIHSTNTYPRQYPNNLK